MFRLLKEASECVPRSSKASLIVALDETCNQWKRIDEPLIQETGVSSWKELLPGKFGILVEEQIQRHHGHVSELFASFQQCIQCSDVEHQRSANLNRYCTSRSDVHHDLMQIPELERSICDKPQFVDKEENEIFDLDQSKVITFQILNSRTSQIHQRIEMLDSQSLLDLRKMIYCVHDCIKILGDADEQSTESSSYHIPIESINFSKVIHESDLFIFGTVEYPYSQFQAISSHIQTIATTDFYDNNHSTTIENISNSSSSKRRRLTLDASAAIRAKELLQQRQRSVSKSTPAKAISSATEFREWDSILLKDLRLEICQSFLFKHCQNCCSHTIQYLDKRSMSMDNESISRFPKETFRFVFRRRRCQICDMENARYIVINDRLVENNPSLMCKACYEMLHYDSSGNLLYSDFSVFPYIHDS